MVSSAQRRSASFSEHYEQQGCACPCVRRLLGSPTGGSAVRIAARQRRRLQRFLFLASCGPTRVQRATQTESIQPPPYGENKPPCLYLVQRTPCLRPFIPFCSPLPACAGIVSLCLGPRLSPPSVLHAFLGRPPPDCSSLTHPWTTLDEGAATASSTFWTPGPPSLPCRPRVRPADLCRCRRPLPARVLASAAFPGVLPESGVAPRCEC